MNKRAQSALEFLTTYGWAFLVILIMIGAFAYFGFLTPKRWIPESCNSEAGLVCEGHAITATSVSVEFANSLGTAITLDASDTQVTTDGTAGVGSPTYTYNTTSLIAGNSTVLVVSGLTNVPEEKFTYDIRVAYTKSGSSLTQYKTITVFGAAQ